MNNDTNDLPSEEIVPHFSISQEHKAVKKPTNFLERVFLLGFKNDFKIIIYSALPIVSLNFIFVK